MFSLIAVILYFAFLLSLPMVFVVYARKAGKIVSERSNSRSIGFCTTAVIIVLPVAWVGLTVVEFRQACHKPTQTYIPRWVEPQQSFLLASDNLDTLSPQKFFSIPLNALATDGIRFYEQPDGARGAKVRLNFLDHSELSKAIRSKYSLRTMIKKLPWRPIFNVTYIVERISDGAVIVSATDVVFGGGIIGKYLSGFDAGQDSEYLSCGYASEKITHWRPNNGSDPSYREYQRADYKFLLKALGH